MNKEEFFKKCKTLHENFMKYDDGCFWVVCKNCNLGFYMFEGTYDSLYNKYTKGCPDCKSFNMDLKVGHSDL